MKFIFCILIFISFVFFPRISFAQGQAHHKVDSIQRLIEKSSEDTNKVLLENNLFQDLILFDTEKAMATAQEMLALAKKLNYTEGIIFAEDNIARTYWVNQDPPSALKVLQEKLALCEKSGRQKDVENCYNNMGAVYRGAKNLDMALEYFQKAFAIGQQLNDTNGLASAYMNIGLIYNQRGEKRKSLPYYYKAKAIRQKQKELRSLAIVYMNIGTAYLELKVDDSARTALDSALLLYKIVGDDVGLANGYQNMGSISRFENEYDKAIAYEDSSIFFSRKTHQLQTIINAYGELSYLEEMKGNFSDALEWQRKKFSLNDSVFNQNMTGQVAEMDAKYNSEKQKRENDKLKSEAQHTAVVTKLLYSLAVLGLLVALAFFYAYRNKRKSNILLSEQNAKIESQKKEITDSITYAKRIQQAIFPSKDGLAKSFPNSFVLYLPKAIVSGDFWWMNEVNGALQIAVADCTGHGVPGAFMSMLGVDKLTAIAQEEKNPDEILSELNRSVKQTLQQVEGNNNDEVRDGMDIAFVKFNREKNKIHFSGANRPVWIFEKNKMLFSGANRPVWICEKNNSWKEFKSTKAAIGGHTQDNQKFELHAIPLNPADTIYLFSDGFADQFGGGEGKKIMTKRMHDWFAEIQNLSMGEQHKELLKRFSDWRGKSEQVDDVLIIGIRI